MDNKKLKKATELKAEIDALEVLMDSDILIMIRAVPKGGGEADHIGISDTETRRFGKYVKLILEAELIEKKAEYKLL